MQLRILPLLALGLLTVLTPVVAQAPKTAPVLNRQYSVDELERRTFNYFWELADVNAQVPDRWPTEAFSSIAATGFGLSSYLVGVERGWITREQAAERVLKTLTVLRNLPQGPAAEGMAGYKGFYYHFLDHKKSLRFGDVELSTIDSGLLLAGILSCQTYFDGNSPAEKSIREHADFIYRRVEWDWMLNANHRLSMGWKPEHDFLNAEWFGYTEAMILYVLALGSPSHPIPADSWESWCQNYSWDETEGQAAHVNFGPLFGHQYSHVWLDFKGIKDPYMAKKGIDYFENSRRATLVNQAYCRRNPGQFKGYSDKVWGLTACDGPKDWLYKNDPQHRLYESWNKFEGYNARGVATDYLQDDGTLAPTAVGGSVPFAPEICLPALETMWNTYYDSLVGPYGFRDAFNPSFTAEGRLPGGWFDKDYLGIDQGPILLMLENQRSGFLWNLMKKNPYIVRGLQRAGFTGGWLDNKPRIASEVPDSNVRVAADRPVDRGVGKAKPGGVMGREVGRFNPEVPNGPIYFFDRATYRKSPTRALPYRLLRPDNGLKTNEVSGYQYNAKGELRSEADSSEMKLPLVIFLHGSGERGTNNEAQLQNAVMAFVEPEQWRKNPCFLLVPQCPKDERWGGVTGDRWNNVAFDEKNPAPAGQMVLELIDQLLKDNPSIDRSRIYITGLSMGGFGTFDLVTRRPELFAAAMPLCGGGDPAFADRIKNVPLWVFHGTRDEAVMPRYSRQMVAALKKSGSKVRYTEFQTLGHGIWQEVFYNPEVMKWLFNQRKQ